MEASNTSCCEQDPAWYYLTRQADWICGLLDRANRDHLARLKQPNYMSSSVRASRPPNPQTTISPTSANPAMTAAAPTSINSTTASTSPSSSISASVTSTSVLPRGAPQLAPSKSNRVEEKASFYPMSSAPVPQQLQTNQPELEMKELPSKEDALDLVG